MKNRAFLVLMEQLVMVLVFSIAAAVCMGLFVRAGQAAEDTARLGDAVLLAQNTAQTLKASGGTEAGPLEHEDYRVEILPAEEKVPGLGAAVIQVFYRDTCLYALETGWQEVLP